MLGGWWYHNGMKNLEVYLPLVNGDMFPLDYPTGRELIHDMLTDDWGPPPTALVFEAKTDDGKTVRISIPYDEKSPASAFIGEDE